MITIKIKSGKYQSILNFLEKNNIYHKTCINSKTFSIDKENFIMLYEFMEKKDAINNFKSDFYLGSTIREVLMERKFAISNFLFEKGFFNPSYLLVKACQEYDADIIFYILTLDPYIDIKSAMNMTCWRLGDYVDIAKALLEYDNISNKNWLSIEPINNACEQGNIKIVKLLIEYGAKPSEEAIKLAIDNNFIDIARYLTDNGVVINNYDTNYFSVQMSRDESLTDLINFFAEQVDLNGVSLLEKMDIKRALLIICKSGLCTNLNSFINVGINVKKYKKSLLNISKYRPDVQKFLNKL